MLAVGSDTPPILLIRDVPLIPDVVSVPEIVTVIPPVVITVLGVPVFASNGVPAAGSIGDAVLVLSVDFLTFDSTAGVDVRRVKISVEGTGEQALHG